jgi:hypothetical protein
VTRTVPTFWSWFFSGTGDKAGWRRIINAWVFLHLCIGLLLAAVVPVSAKEASGIVLIPLASVFVGLTFAWVANVQAALMTSELGDLSEHRAGGYAEYVFPYQLGVLTVLVCLATWGLAGVGVLEHILGSCANSIGELDRTLILSGGGNRLRDCWSSLGSDVILFTLISLAFRECWRLIGGTMLLLVARHLISSRNKG